LPYAWILRSEIVSVLKNKPRIFTKGLLNFLLKLIFPKYEHEGFLALSPVNVLSFELMKIQCANPWMPDVMADRIILESKAMLDSYISDGVSSKKCIILGSGSQDILYANRTSELNSETVLAFIPPDQTSHQIKGFEFENYWDMIEFYVDSILSVFGKDTVFSIHPRMKFMISQLQKTFTDINIYLGDACELIPSTKLCIGSMSGILRYVLSGGKPLLYYDMFNYKIFEFSASESVLVASSKREFIQYLIKMKTDNNFIQDLLIKSKRDAMYWGNIDGGSVGRIEKFLVTNYLTKSISQV